MKRSIGYLAAAFAVLLSWEIGLRPLINTPASGQSAGKEKDNEELIKLYTEDQADRMPKDGKAINWAEIGPRDKTRLTRVKEIYSSGKLLTAPDYYHAAMVLQHAHEPSAFLLAHELCVVAIGKGDKRAKWLAAASEDRFLMNINRPQRFGTQFKSDGGGPFFLYKTEESVTDDLRKEFGVPTLEESKKRAEKMNEKQEPKKLPT